jgi:tetrathionate reductase subunit B
MSWSRRDFLRNTLKGAIAASLPLSAFKFLTHAQVEAALSDPALRWAFLVNTRNCVGCGFCVEACKKENEIPYDAQVTRTWVERYVVTKDWQTRIDTPKGGRDGFIEQKIRGEEIPPGNIAKAFFVPKLCNQCDLPPCVQVCPVGATYQANDGVVLVDRSWCIGCGYCIMACPYGVRFFHPVYKVADKCNFCYHRICKGMRPACVQACAFDARKICNLKDPNDAVTRVIMSERVAVLKEEYGTRPRAFYIGLDENVR